MKLEVKIARFNVAAFLRSIEKDEQTAMAEFVGAEAVKLGERIRRNYESGQAVNTRGGRFMRENTVAYPPKVTATNISAGVGIRRRAFWALFLEKGVKKSWLIRPHPQYKTERGRARHPGFVPRRAVSTPFGPRAYVKHPPLARRWFMHQALKDFKPEFRVDLIAMAKSVIAKRTAA